MFNFNYSYESDEHLHVSSLETDNVLNQNFYFDQINHSDDQFDSINSWTSEKFLSKSFEEKVKQAFGVKNKPQLMSDLTPEAIGPNNDNFDFNHRNLFDNFEKGSKNDLTNIGWKFDSLVGRFKMSFSPQATNQNRLTLHESFNDSRVWWDKNKADRKATSMSYINSQDVPKTNADFSNAMISSNISENTSNTKSTSVTNDSFVVQSRCLDVSVASASSQKILFNENYNLNCWSKSGNDILDKNIQHKITKNWYDAKLIEQADQDGDGTNCTTSSNDTKRDTIQDLKVKTWRYKRNRKRKSKNIDLSKRRDVLNKAVLRSMRRFLMNKFRDFAHDKFEGKIHRKIWYFDTIKEFTKANYTLDGKTEREIQFHLACIILPKTLIQSKIFYNKDVEGQIYNFYNWIYKYSHTRLIHLISLEPIRIIYENFYKEVVENVSVYEPIYKIKDCSKKAYDEFKDVFWGLRSVESLITM